MNFYIGQKVVSLIGPTRVGYISSITRDATDEYCFMVVKYDDGSVGVFREDEIAAYGPNY